MIRVVRDVLDIATAVSGNFHVTINRENLERTAKVMLSNPLPEKQVDEKKIDAKWNNRKEIILEELVADSINYCYWLCDSDIRPNDSGSTKMRQLLSESFNSKLAIRSRMDLVAQLREFYRAMMINRFPLMDKRLKNLMALARPLVVYGATNASPHSVSSVANILVDGIANEDSMWSFEMAFNFLITEVDGFGDDPFLKRAFLFFLQLNRIFGLYEEEVKTLPVPADYQVPKMLHYNGILDYSDDLEYMVRNGIHLSENGPEEMAIRAGTILACRDLSDLTGWPPSKVDGWFFVRRKESNDYFHLTITSNY